MTEVTALAGLRAHPLRKAVLGELHARPFVSVSTPRQFVHYAFLTRTRQAQTPLQGPVGRWVDQTGATVSSLSDKSLLADKAEGRLRWEGHNEFDTYTWEIPPSQAASDAPAPRPNDPILNGALRPDGELIAAVRLRLLDETTLDLPTRERLREPAYNASRLDGGRATICSTFAPDGDGFVEIWVLNSAMSGFELGALVQRVLEIETYRCLALLGLPIIQAQAPAIQAAEDELPPMLARLSVQADLEDSRRLLSRISKLSADLEAASAAMAFRVAATRAYHEIVQLRLAALGEDAAVGRCTWSAFLARRLDPAVRTCMAMEDRQRRLSERLGRAGQLLTTRIELSMQQQNQEMLAALNERARLQLSLQHTVEGLSVVAMTYYGASVFHYLALGAHSRAPWLDVELATGLSIAPIALVLMFSLGLIRRAHVERQAGKLRRLSWSATYNRIRRWRRRQAPGS